MKFFVTGGAGFIGSNLVERLLADGNEVTVYDNMREGKQEFMDRFASNANFKQVIGDLNDLEKTKEAMKGCDMVFHLAANSDVRFGVENTRKDVDNGILATYNVLETMRLVGVKKIGFSSSSVIYGEAKEFPTPESYGPLMPISIYGGSKLSAEALISAFANSFGFTAYIYRFANIIGKNGTHGILVDFLKKVRANPSELEVLGNGSQEKSYLLVEDCCDAMIYVAENAKERVNIFNLGGPDSINVKRITEIFIETVSPSTKIKYAGGDRGWVGDVPKMMLDVKKLNDLGWKSKHTSEEAIRIALKHILIQEKK